MKFTLQFEEGQVEHLSLGQLAHRAQNLHTPEIPDYFKYLRPDSLLNGRDVAKLFGFSNSATVANLAWAGSFPKPDLHLGSIAGGSEVSQWRVSTILKEIARRTQLRDAYLSMKAACTPTTIIGPHGHHTTTI